MLNDQTLIIFFIAFLLLFFESSSALTRLHVFFTPMIQWCLVSSVLPEWMNRTRTPLPTRSFFVPLSLLFILNECELERILCVCVYAYISLRGDIMLITIIFLCAEMPRKNTIMFVYISRLVSVSFSFTIPVLIHGLFRAFVIAFVFTRFKECTRSHFALTS